MDPNLAEDMMRAAIARSKRFNILVFTKIDPFLNHHRHVYLRNRENLLPASYDDDQQNAKAGGIVEGNPQPGTWIPENTAIYYLHDYDFVQEPFLLRLQTL